VTAHDPDPYPLDTGNLSSGTQTALSCLQSEVASENGTLTVTSGYRPQSYQDHLREVWTKWQLIKDNEDSACAATKEQIQGEWNLHGIVYEPPPVSNHTGGTAFDATWTGSFDIDDLASECNLSRPAAGDPVHFVYSGG
jgi:LAS superfamily LD-carboxypeptidase LdcB